MQPADGKVPQMQLPRQEDAAGAADGGAGPRRHRGGASIVAACAGCRRQGAAGAVAAGKVREGARKGCPLQAGRLHRRTRYKVPLARAAFAKYRRQIAHVQENRVPHSSGRLHGADKQGAACKVPLAWGLCASAR